MLIIRSHCWPNNSSIAACVMEPALKKSKMVNKSKLNKRKYFQQNKRQVLQPGHRGFLVTCNMNEKACVRESYNLLNQYADELYGPEVQKKTEVEDKTKEKSGSDSDSSEDMDAAVAKCREEFAQRKVRFQSVDTGTTNCLFIRTKLDDPLALAKHIVEDIAATGKAMSRFILRLVPIETVCRANMPDIIKAAGTIFDKHFSKEPSTYGIIFNHRYNQQIKREDIVKELAELVNSKNADNKVDLKGAKKSVIVEVVRGWCLLSVIENYLGNKRYNISELTSPTVQTTKPEKSEDESENNEQLVEKPTETVEK